MELTNLKTLMKMVAIVSTDGILLSVSFFSALGVQSSNFPKLFCVYAEQALRTNWKFTLVCLSFVTAMKLLSLHPS
jgi:hypothetical protein